MLRGDDSATLQSSPAPADGPLCAQEASGQLCFSSLGDLVQSPLQGGSASSRQRRLNSNLPGKSSLCEKEPWPRRVNAFICPREPWPGDPHRKAVAPGSQQLDAKRPVLTRPSKKTGGSQETTITAWALSTSFRKSFCVEKGISSACNFHHWCCVQSFLTNTLWSSFGKCHVKTTPRHTINRCRHPVSTVHPTCWSSCIKKWVQP